MTVERISRRPANVDTACAGRTTEPATVLYSVATDGDDDTQRVALLDEFFDAIG